MADAFADVLELIVRDYAITDAQKDVDLNATADEPAAVIEADKEQIVTEATERRAGSTPQRLPSAAAAHPTCSVSTPRGPALPTLSATSPGRSQRAAVRTRAAAAELRYARCRPQRLMNHRMVRRAVKRRHNTADRTKLREDHVSRILYIAPVNVDGDFLERDVEDAARPENDVTVLGFSRGPRHVEYHYYETLVLPDLIHTIMEAEQLGYDAAVIGCFYDLGLQEGREVTESMVVTAPCEASCLLAASLGSTFSIIVGRRKWIPQMRNTRRATQSTQPRVQAA